MERKEGFMKPRLVITAVLAITVLAAALLIAQTAPPKDPDLIDLQGYQKVLQQYKGKPLLVNFWATYCEPCRDEYPMLNELAKQWGLLSAGNVPDHDKEAVPQGGVET